MKTLLLSLHPVENMSSFFECFKVKVCHRLKIVPLKLSVKRVKPIKQQTNAFSIENSHNIN